MDIVVKKCKVNDVELKRKVDSLLTYLVDYLIEKIEHICIYKEGYDDLEVGEGSTEFNLKLEQVEDDSSCEKISIIFINKITVVEGGMIRRCYSKDTQARINICLDKSTYKIKATLDDEANVLFENDNQFEEIFEKSVSRIINLIIE